ncbi:MAG: hypothetical protein VX379_10350 [Pseudomonadota bacterium]|nr:hypothetical protein [Pseudomonadota bacterium]MEE3320834.1 hypothetical protein [Pseudomonadota bacterium]
MTVAVTPTPPEEPGKNAPLGQGDVHQGKRHLVIPCKKGQTNRHAFLRLADPQHGWLNLPLGTVTTLPHQEALAQASAPVTNVSNLLVPVVPLVYTTPTLEREQATPPRAGRLYLFVNGYLWRELECLGDGGEGGTHYAGHYKDVNLQYVCGLDPEKRPATGTVINRITVPFRIGNQAPTLEIAYAEVAWSWEYINSLGGMHPDDFRLKDRTVTMPSAEQQAQAAERRTRRLQRLDLSGIELGFPFQDCRDNIAACESAEHSPANLHFLPLSQRQHVPAVYLHDPLGISQQLVADVQVRTAALKEQLAQMQAHPHYQSAVLINRVCFDPALWNKSSREGASGQMSRPTYDQKGLAARAQRNAASKIDRQFLQETVLRTAERKALRQALNQSLQSLADFWVAEPKSPPSDWVSLEAVLEDFAAQQGPAVVQLYHRAALHLTPLHSASADIDMGHDLLSEEDQNLQRPGGPVLARLLDEEDPLHQLLFPSKDSVDAFAYGGLQASPADVPVGQCPVHALRQAFQPDPLRQQEEEASLAGLLKISDTLFANMETLLLAAWAQTGRGEDAHQQALETTTRLGKAAGYAQFQESRVARPNETLAKGERPVGAQHLDLDNTPVPSRTPDPEFDSREWAQRLYDRHGAIIAGWDDIHEARVAGSPDPRIQAAPEAIWVQQGESIKTRSALLVSSKAWLMALAEARHRPYASGHPPLTATLAKGIHLGQQVMPPLLYPLEIMNLVAAWKAYAQKKNAGNDAAFEKVYAYAASAGVTIASLSLINHLFTPEKVHAYLTPAKSMKPMFAHSMKVMQTTMTGEFRKIKRLQGVRYIDFAAGTITALEGVFQFYQAFVHADRNDVDAALLYGVSGGGFIGAGVSQIIQARLKAAARDAIKNAVARNLLQSRANQFGLWGWAFMAVGLVASLAAHYLSDTQLETWAKDGPFADTHPNSTRDSLASLTPEQTWLALILAIQPPRLTLQRYPAYQTQGAAWSRATVQPGAVPEDSSITLRAEALHKESNQPHQATALVEPCFNDAGQQIGLHYFIPPWRGWADPLMDGRNLQAGTETIHWLVRAQIQLPNGSQLPLQKDKPHGWYEATRTANFLDGREI